MGLFDIFSSSNNQDAANQGRSDSQKYNQYSRDYIDKASGQSHDYLNSGYSSGRDSLNSGYSNARNAYSNAYNTGTGAVNQGYSDAYGAMLNGAQNSRNIYGQARSDTANYADKAANSYNDLSALGAKYGKSTSLLQDALGVNGADAANRAMGQFKTSDAYNFNMNQGMDAINRRRAAGGMLNSGNADQEAQKFGAGLASNEIGNWQNQLAGFINPELAATSGAATGRANAYSNAENNLANLGNSQAGMEFAHGNDIANLSTNHGSMLASLANTYGTNMGNSYTNQGTAENNSYTNQGKDNASVSMGTINPYMHTYDNQSTDSQNWSKYVADSQDSASGNTWGAIFGAANMGLKATGWGGYGFGGSGGGGSSGGSGGGG